MAEEAKTKEPEAVAPTTPNITATDIATVVRIIDAGSQRGAWRGEELATIGAVRDKFSAVVKALTPAAPAEEASEDAVVEDAAEETVESK